MNSRSPNRNLSWNGVVALERLLQSAPRDRHVAPAAQPFAYSTNHGKVRGENQDTALVLAGRRSGKTKPFLAAILCDGIGGLEDGDMAAALAAACTAAVLGAQDDEAPLSRMRRAILEANSNVFNRFRRRAGTVIVAALLEAKQTIVGWIGDARAYGLRAGATPPELLTQDDDAEGEDEDSKIPRRRSSNSETLRKLLEILHGEFKGVTPVKTESS